jgi:hypothetical protein
MQAKSSLGALPLLDGVAKRFAPRLAPDSEALFAGCAVPLRAVRPYAASPQDVTLPANVPRSFRRQAAVGNSLYILVAVASRTSWPAIARHGNIISLRRDHRQAELSAPLVIRRTLAGLPECLVKAEGSGR